MSKDNKNIPLWAKNIKYLVEKDECDVSAIAFDAKITRTHLKNIMNGTLTNCRIDTLARLAHTLRCSLSCIYYCKNIDKTIATRSKAREVKRYEV